VGCGHYDWTPFAASIDLLADRVGRNSAGRRRACVRDMFRAPIIGARSRRRTLRAGAVTNLIPVGKPVVLLGGGSSRGARSASSQGLNNINAGLPTRNDRHVPFSHEFRNDAVLLSDSKTYSCRRDPGFRQSGAVRTLENRTSCRCGETATFLVAVISYSFVQSLSGGAPTTYDRYKDFGVSLLHADRDLHPTRSVSF